MTLRHVVPAILLALLLAIGIARGEGPTGVPLGLPSPSKCTVDPCIRVCPAGDMAFHVIVRDALGNPIAFSKVAVDFGACPAIVLCPLLGTEPYTILIGTTVVMDADGSGVADIPIRAGGVCAGSPINIYASGFLIAQRFAVVSPDQNGDTAVNATDQAIHAVKVGGLYDPTADFNCGGSLGADDTGILATHLGHSCQAVVPVTSRSWGSVKTIYR